MPFPFVDCTLFPFAVINHRHEYNYMLSPVNSPSESLSGGFPTQTCFNFSQSLCYWSLQCWHNGHMNRVAMVAETEAIYTGPRPLSPTHQGWYWYCLLSNIQPDSKREKCWVPNTASSLRRPTRHLVASWMHWISSTLKVVSAETNTYWSMGLHFMPVMPQLAPVSQSVWSTKVAAHLILHQTQEPTL